VREVTLWSQISTNFSTMPPPWPPEKVLDKLTSLQSLNPRVRTRA